MDRKFEVGDIVQHFKRETKTHEELEKEPNVYLYEIIGVSRNTETKEQIIERFKRAYREINEVNKYNYIVINDCVDTAVSKVEAIIKAEKCRVNRIEDFDLNTKEEMLHELLTEDLKDYDK